MNAVQYIKNVGKSFGYVAVDTLKSYNPTIDSVASQAKSLSTDLYQYVKDFKSSTNDRLSGSENSLIGIGKDTVGDLWKNVKSDLMTGNFYNKARKEEADQEMAKAMGLDFDFDFNFDDDFGDLEFNDDMGPSTKNEASEEIEVQVKTTEAMIRSMDSVGSAMSGSINMTNIKTAEYIVAAQERSSKALYDLNTRGFKQVNTGLAAINANMTTIATLAEPLTVHMQNSATFYTQTSEYQKKTLELLGKIVENTSPIQPKKGSRSSRGTIDDLMSGGFIDIKAYAEYVGGNFKDYFSMVTSALGMMGGLKGVSKQATASPLSSAMTAAMKSVMPKVLKESMKDFNEMLEGMMGTFLGSMGSRNFGIFEILKDMFLPTSTYKGKLDPSKYNKGKVDWDGKSRKALLEVIPTYLAEISAALTGGPMKVYDFDSGRFKTISKVKSEWTQQFQDQANMAGGDLRYRSRDVLNMMVKNNQISAGKRDKMMSEIESYLLVALQSGDDDFLNIMKNNFNHIKYGLSDDSVKFIRSLFKYADSNKNRSFRANTTANIYKYRNSTGNRIRDIEDTGDSVFTNIFNMDEERRSTALLGVDEHNHDIFFYLRGIYENTSRGGGKGKGRKGSSTRPNRPSGSGSSSSTADIIGSFADIDESALNNIIRDSFSEERIKFNDPEMEAYYYNRQYNPNFPIDEEMENKLEKFFKIRKDLGKLGEKLSNNPVIKKAFDIIGVGRDMIDKATRGIAGLIDSAGNSIANFVYGENGTIGLFETIKGLITDFRGTLQMYAHQAGDYFFGESGKFRPYMNKVKSSMKDAAKWVKNRVIPTAANGRRVTRSGIVAVSEGEMIIPAELNPYYRGSINKNSQRRNEARAIRRFYGAFNDGGIVGDDLKGGTDQGIGATVDESAERTKGISLDFVSKVFKAIFPDKPDEEAKKVQDTVSKALDELKVGGASIGAGAAIGTGVSLLTGGMISPILGAGIGAAAGLVVKSKTVQDYLFGNEEKDGALPKNLTKFIKTNLPDMAAGGAVGLVGGTFMGSPVMGALLGAMVGYVKTSKKAQEFLFGSEESDTGLISKEFQKNIKKKFPKMALGAIGGLVAGPFGLVPNLILGSAIGYAADLEKSKNWLLGEEEADGKRTGGFLEAAKENFFNPLVTIFDNLAESLRHTIRDVFHGLSKNITNFLSNRMKKSKIAGKVGRFAGKVGDKLYNFGGNILGGSMRGLATGLSRRSMRKGYMMRDRNSETGYLDAAGRIKRREELGMSDTGMYAGFDNILSQIEDQASFDELQQGLEAMYKGTTSLNRKRSAAEKDASRKLVDAGVDKSTANKINKALHDRDYTKARDLMRFVPDGPVKNRILQDIASQETYQSKISKIEGDRQKLSNLIGRDVKDSDIANLMDYTSLEAKSKKFKSAEAVREENAQEAVAKVPGLLEDIIRAIVDKNSHNDLATKYKGSSGGNSGGADIPLEGDNQERNGVKFTYHNGAWVDEEELTTKQKFMHTINEHFPTLSNGLTKINGFFGNIKTKLFGDPNDKENKGLLGGIFDKFFGEESLFGNFISIFTGSKLGKGLKSALGKVNLFSIAKTVIGPALLAGGFSGAFDGVAAAVGWGKENNQQTVTEDGTTVVENVNPETGEKTYVDPKTGQTVTGDVNVKRTDRYTLSESLKYGTARGLLTGKKTLAGTTIKNSLKQSKTGKTVLSKLNNFDDTLKNVGKSISSTGNAADSALTFILKDVDDGLVKFASKIKTLPVFKSKIGSQAVDGIISKVSKTFAKAATSGAAKSIAQFASKAVIWLNVVFIITDFTTGYEDAATTMKVKNPTTGLRIMSGLLRAIKNFIPVIGVLIPDDLLVDIFVEFVAPLLGIPMEELNAQRREAQAEVDAYNSTHGTSMDWSEYNKTVRQDYTWTERIGNAVRSTTNDISTGWNNMTSGIKQKGFGEYMKESFDNMGTTFIDAFNEKDNPIQGIFNGIGETFQNMLPGVLKDISEAKESIREKAAAGDLKGLWEVSLPDFSGGGKNADGIETAMPSMFSKIIGQIPLALTKLTMTIPALTTSAINSIGDIGSDVWDSIKGFFGNDTTGKATTAKGNVLGESIGKAVSSGIFGGSSGFVSQVDPKYSSMRIGNSNVGALGCGPASAVMALNQYSGDMNNAVNVANAYQSGAGTDAAFFADYYARNGAKANYYNGLSSAGRSNIINQIASGSPVVLMGRDSRNTSKSNSPFGPNNHYVVASGFDGAGNLIINDPESRTPNRRYSSKILNNVQLGIGIGAGRSGLYRRLGLSAGGGGLRNDATTRAVWQFFKNKGYSEAAIAGIMGNLQQESGIDPASHQVGGSAKGIAQWEGARFNNLVAFAKSRGKDWTDLDSQLAFIDKELQSLDKYFSTDIPYGGNIPGSTLTNAGAVPTTFAKWKRSTDVEMATRQFEGAFERAGKPHMDKRIQYAAYYYQQFTGKTFTYAPSAVNYSGDPSSSYSTTSSTGGNTVANASSGFGILSTITNAFSKIGDIFTGSSDSSMNSSSTGGLSNSIYPDLGNVPDGTGTAQSFIDIARSQLGTEEGEGNKTKYGQFTGMDGQAWCASFVSWCMNQAFNGNKNKTNTALRGKTSAAVSTLWDQFKNSNSMSSTPQPGDIVIYKNNGASHTGLVETVNGNMITTIEGNTSDSNGYNGNGGLVARKTYDYTTHDKLTGFGRPDWAGAQSAAGSGLLRVPERRQQFSVVHQTGGSHVGSKKYSAGASGISKDTAALLKVIIELVQTLVKNTDRIDNIHDVLVQIAKSKLGADADAIKAIDDLSSSNDSSSIEATLSGLRATVDSILAS